MKAVKTQSWNSSEYQNLKLSLQHEINPKPHLNTASVFIISVTDAIFLLLKIYLTLGLLLQGSYIFNFLHSFHGSKLFKSCETKKSRVEEWMWAWDVKA